MRCPALTELPPPPPGKTGWPWTEESEPVPDEMPDGRPWPLVSIVTPSYNQGQFIEETIRSVLLQGYPSVEYFIMDGGSTDGSVDIIRRYAPWLSSWVSEKDRGQVDAINKGWARSHGEIVAWLNSDDVYLRQVLSHQVWALCQHPESGLVYGEAVFTDVHGRPLRPFHARPFSRRRLLHVNLVPQPTAFFRRNLIETCGGLDASFQSAFDYEFLLRGMWVAPFYYTGELVATYRLHTESKTVSGSEQSIEETIRIVQRVCDRHPVELRGVKRKSISDWYWSGAMRGVDARAARDVLRYCAAAIQAYPVRPRMIVFGLKMIDTVFHTEFVEDLVLFLDKRAGSS